MHLDRVAQRHRPLSQPANQRRTEPADTLPGLVDIPRRERSVLHQFDDQPIDDRANRLHEVVCEGAAVPLVGVKDADGWIEAVHLEHNGRLGLEDRVRRS